MTDSRHLATLRDMRAFSANDSEKPALDWAILALSADRGEAVGEVNGSFRVLDGSFGHCVISATRLDDGTKLYLHPPSPAESAEEMSPEFTDTARAALLWVLWHHQGGSSPVGQAMRQALGMGQHEHLSPTQLSEAKRWAEISHQATAAAPSGVSDAMVVAAAKELCKRHAGECNVDADDTWNIYSDSFKDDARAALEAAQPQPGRVEGMK